MTGRHPFNVEPHLPRLLQKGWTTPSSLHYVRNHGAVPIKWHGDEERRAVWSNWRIEIGGLVDTQLSVTLDELASMQQVRSATHRRCAAQPIIIHLRPLAETERVMRAHATDWL